MNDPSNGETLDRLAESFLEHLRQGKHPSLSEYAARQPELADEIRELFPALIELENLKHASGGVNSGFATGIRAAEEPLPERLGDYRIIRLIGKGGMGVVYEAERESLRARVALKVLHPRIRDDAGFRKRFRNEARSAARLHHNNIVPVFDFGEQDGALFYAMQFIPGHGLERILADVRRLRRGPSPPPLASTSTAPATIADGLLTGQFPLIADDGIDIGSSSLPEKDRAGSQEPGSSEEARPAQLGVDDPEASPDGSSLSSASFLVGAGPGRYYREVARIGAESAEALAYAHSRGVQHRDIKPSNVLLDTRGTAWITDFGLAKIEGDEGLTETGNVVGTLRYLAPERFEGRSDTRCDIYALGVTLYEMLALRPAFDQVDRAKVIRQILDGRPTPLRQIDPRISRDLETVVQKAMARAPEDRYPDAAELAAELRRILGNQPIRSRRTPAHEQYWRWCKRNKIAAALTALASVLTIAVSIVSTVAYFREIRLYNAINEQLHLVEAAEAAKSEQLWGANLAEARAWRYSRRPGRRFESLAAIRRAVAIGRDLGHSQERFDALRYEAISALGLADISITRSFGRRATGESVELADDFEHYCVSDAQGHCTIRRVSDDSVVLRLPDLPAPRRSVFGRGKWLIDFDGTGTARVWDLSGAEPIVRVQETAGEMSWDFRQDGTAMAMTHADGSLVVYELPSGRRLHKSPLGVFNRRPVIRIHPHLPYVVLASYFAAHVELRPLDGSRGTPILPAWDNGGSLGCDWSADGRRLILSRGDGGALAPYEFDPVGAILRPLKTIRNQSWGGAVVRLNPAGDRLIAFGWNNCLSLYDLDTGQELASSLPIGIPRRPELKLDASGTRAFPGYTSDSDLKYGYCSIAEGRESRLLVPESPVGQEILCAVSPDGRLAVSGSNTGTVTIFDLETGRDLARARLASAGAIQPFFDGTGRLYTCSPNGVSRWPIREDPGESGTICFGPPERLALKPGANRTTTSRDGNVFAQAFINQYANEPNVGGWILSGDDASRPRHAAPGHDLSAASVSPDGRWVAFGYGIESTGTAVFDARTTTQVWRCPDSIGDPRFSPDGRWLAVCNDHRTDLYRVGTWERGPALGQGYFCSFSPDSSLAYLLLTKGTMRIVQIPSGREIARFEDPTPDAASCERVAPTPDGTKLVLPALQGLRVWDLRLIREELARLGLDWDAPPFPPRRARSGPLRVRIIGEGLEDPRRRQALDIARALIAPFWKRGQATARDFLDRGRAFGRLELYGLARRDFDEAVRRDPSLGETYMARGLEAFRRSDWRDAVTDFTAALRSMPESRALSFRRAWAYHELHEDERAVADLTSALALKSAASPRGPSLRILRASLYAAMGQAGKADADLKAAGANVSELIMRLNMDAWELLMATPEMRADAAALLLARKSIDLQPLARDAQNTLALALYRNGKYAEAASILEKSVAAGTWRYECWDLYFLAMCQQRLGKPAEAGRSFERAGAWHHQVFDEKNKRELSDIESEARRTLGLAR